MANLADQGITNPFPIQTLTIPDGLAGRDVCGKAKTGSGKTLAFGLPLVERTARRPSPAGPAPSCSCPTRELALQVARGARAARPAPRPAVAGRLRRRAASTARSRSSTDGVDVVVATPGRLIDLIDRRRGRRSPTSAMVVARRGRPHGRHGLPAPGRVDPPPRRPGPTRRCCSRPRSTAPSTRWSQRYLRDPVRHEVASPTSRDRRGDGATASSTSTRWTR